VQLNAATYYYDYPSFHLLTFNVISNRTGSQKATNYGAELDLTVKPVHALTLSANAGYTRMRVKDVNNAYGISATRDAPLAPHLTVNALARYDFGLASGSNFGIQMDARKTDSFYTEADNFDSELVPESTRANVRADFTSADGKWIVAGFVNNVFDSQNLAEAFDLAGFGYQFSIPLQPRWYGVQLNYRFENN